MISSKAFRVWAVVERSSGSVVFCSSLYSMAKNCYDSLIRCCDSADDLNNAFFRELIKSEFAFVRYNIDAQYREEPRTFGRCLVDVLKGDFDKLAE